MFRLTRDNVVKLTPDPDKRDRLIADGYSLEEKEKPSEDEPTSEEQKPKSGKAAADGKRTDKT